MRRIPSARRGGPTWPTLAAELLRARDELTVAQGVGLALRADRRALGASQRAYAERRGWSKTHQHRLEADAASLRLGQVIDALQGTGYELAIAREDEELPVGTRPETPRAGLGRRVWPVDWRDHELIGHDRGGRRFPADREVRRVSSPPSWWLWRHATDIRVQKPAWTAAPLPTVWSEELRSEVTTRVAVGSATVEDMDTTAATPRVDRPRLPDGYGIPETAEGQLLWSDVEPRLVQAMHYWITSVRPDGTPHSVPRWGVWLDGRFWYDGAPTTRHTRNVEQNPAVTLTLESGTEVVIVEGESAATRAEVDGLGARLAEAFAKYADSGYAPDPDSWSGPDGGGLRVITPRRALAWFAFPTDCTRFRF